MRSRANCILISMKAKNPVCAVRRVGATKGHNVAKWIAVQHRDHFHFKQVQVWVSLCINIPQGIFTMQGTPISQRQILHPVIFKIQWEFQDQRGPKRQKPPFWSALFSNCFAKTSWKAGDASFEQLCCCAGKVALKSEQQTRTLLYLFCCERHKPRGPNVGQQRSRGAGTFQNKPWSAAGEPWGGVGTLALGPSVASSSQESSTGPQVWASPSCSWRGRGLF